MATQQSPPVQSVPVGARVVNPRPETAEKRQRILEAAMAIFGTKGYSNGSLLEIGEQAGMSHAGVVHHFGSKDQLLVAMLEYRDSSDLDHLDGQHLPDGSALFRHLVETTRVNLQRPGVVQAYTVLSADSVTDGHPAQSFFRERFVGLRQILTRALREVAPADTDEFRLSQAASTIIGAMDGLQVQWLLDPEAINMPQAVEAVIESMIAWLNGAAS